MDARLRSIFFSEIGDSSGLHRVQFWRERAQVVVKIESCRTTLFLRADENGDGGDGGVGVEERG